MHVYSSTVVVPKWVCFGAGALKSESRHRFQATPGIGRIILPAIDLGVEVVPVKIVCADFGFLELIT